MIRTVLFRSAFLLLFMFQVCESFCQDTYGYYKGQKVKYGMAEDKLLIMLNNSKIQNFDFERFGIDSLLEQSINGLYIAFVNPEKKSRGVNNIIAEIQGDKNVYHVSPILLNDSGKEFGGLTDKVIVKVKKGVSTQKFHHIIKEVGAEIVKGYEYDSLMFYISANDRKVNTLRLSNDLYESNLFEFSEPDFLLFIDKASRNKKDVDSFLQPVDLYYPQQWALNNTGQFGGTAGCDIDAPEAWTMTTGSSSIAIAVLDDGVQLDHPDLSPNLLSGYDCTSGITACSQGGWWGGPDLCYTPGDYHGTNVAGVAAAAGGSNNLGVTGVAYTSKIVPVRVMLHTQTGSMQDITTAGWMAAGIDWSRSRADILNLSFGIAVGISAVDNAINNAVTLGRGGRGCIIVAATHNHGINIITFPSSHQSVIAVGGSTNNDSRVIDSNFGVGLDVVAPGEDIYTTDLMGTKGKGNGDYVLARATSMATPAASGVVALILSINSSLTFQQTRMLLESTAEKVGGYSYATAPGQPNGTWNQEMGYGRINAYRAVKATSASNIVGPSLICTTGNFSLGVVPNVTVTWSSSNSSILTINSVTGAASRVAGNSGSVDIMVTYSSSASSYSLIKRVWVGTPIVLGIQYNNSSWPEEVCMGQSVWLQAVLHSQYPGYPTFSWAASNAFVVADAGSSAQVQFAGVVGATASVSLNVSNVCGTAQGHATVIRSITNCGGPGTTTRIYPNPSKTLVNIEFPNIAKVSDFPTEIILYSESTMNPVKSVLVDKSSIDDNFKLEVNDLPRGTYYVHIIHGEKKYVEKFRVVLE